MTKLHYTFMLFCGASAISISQIAVAQDAGVEHDMQAMGQSENGVRSGGLQEIIVTANRREANLQDAPISITAISGETLSATGITDTVALQQVTPGLTFNQNASFAQPYLRGIGTDITPPGSESSVATFVDGVYQAFPFVGIQVLNAVERIEVLKGPQGTLYGRNATGGAINIQTRSPDTDFAAEGEVSYGNYDARMLRGYVSVPISDAVAFNVAGTISKRDGFGENLTNGEDYNSEDYQYIRGKLLIDVTDNLEMILSGYYFHRDDDSYMAYTYEDSFGSIPGTGGNVTIGSQDVFLAYPIQNRINDYGGNLRLTWSTDVGELTSITAFQNAKATIGPDFVSTDVPVFNFRARTTGKSISQELYLSGLVGDIAYLVGGNYFTSSARFDPNNVFFGPSLGFSDFQYIDNDAFAIYGEGTYDFTDAFSVTGGLRYSYERKVQDRLDQIAPDGTINSSAPHASRSWDNVTYKLSAKYDFGPAMVYGKFETGFKSGTAVASVPGLFIAPEKITSYEAGFKSEMLDGTLRLNGAGFYYDYKNLQVQYTDVTTGQALLESADAARIWGAEIQMTIAPVRNFSVDIGATYLNAEYTDFLSSGVFVPNTVIAGPGTPGNTNVTLDVSDNDLVRTPPITINVGMNWEVPLANDSSIMTTLNGYFSDSYYFDVTNRTQQKSYTILSGQVRYTLPGGRFSIAVFGRNLTDTEYYSIMTPNAFGDQAQLSPPRTYGITLSAKY